MKFNIVNQENDVNVAQRGDASGMDCTTKQGAPDRHHATAKMEKQKKKKNVFKIATWNVRTLLQHGKLENVKKEMDRLKFDILGISEMRWKGSGRIQTDDHTVIFSGSENRSEMGVGMIFNKKWSKKLTGFWPISERVLLAKLSTAPMPMNIVQVYAPTATSTDSEIEAFYDDVKTAINKCKSRDITMVIGDWNAKVGNKESCSAVGPFGLDERNERGDRFIEWCDDHKMVISNTWFQNRKSRLYTWRSPGDRTRNQIDYICVNERWRNSILDCKTYPGADIGSDHNPVVAKVRVILKKTKATELRSRRDYQSIDPATSHEIEHFGRQIWTNEDRETKETTWEKFKRVCHLVDEKFVPVRKQHKNGWITEEILELMEKRRKVKFDDKRYKEIDRIIKRKCMEEKMKYYDAQCNEIELTEKYMPRDHHQRIQQVTGKKWKNRKDSNVLKDKEGNIMIEKDQIIERWREYIEELYSDDERLQETIKFEGELTGNKIEKDEIVKAMNTMKTDKAIGTDEIPVETIRNLGNTGLDMLQKLFNEVYESGKWENEIMESTFIPLPKKPKAIDCINFRTISIMNHSTKILLRIIINRMKNAIHAEVNECQYGFMPDKGTRNAVYVLNRIAERSKQVQKKVFCCFIDYTKAFDRVQHNILFEILSDLDVNDKDIRLMHNLYFGQKANIRVCNTKSENVDIKKGVRQGCVASPDLFSLYSEVIMRAIDRENGVNIGGHNITNIRFADDTVLTANTADDLQILLEKTNAKCRSLEWR